MGRGGGAGWLAGWGYLAQDQQQQGGRRVRLVAERERPAGVWIKGALVVMWAEVQLEHVGGHEADLVLEDESPPPPQRPPCLA